LTIPFVIPTFALRSCSEWPVERNTNKLILSIGWDTGGEREKTGEKEKKTPSTVIDCCQLYVKVTPSSRELLCKISLQCVNGSQRRKREKKRRRRKKSSMNNITLVEMKAKFTCIYLYRLFSSLFLHIVMMESLTTSAETNRLRSTVACYLRFKVFDRIDCQTMSVEEKCAEGT
jgi:hypothetical protein